MIGLMICSLSAAFGAAIFFVFWGLDLEVAHPARDCSTTGTVRILALILLAAALASSFLAGICTHG